LWLDAGVGGEDIDDFLLDEGGVHVKDCEACWRCGDGCGEEDEFEGVRCFEGGELCMVAEGAKWDGGGKDYGENVWRIIGVEEAVGVLDGCDSVGYGLNGL